MRYYVESTGTGTSTNHWSLGLTGDLVTTVAAILAAPSPGGDEIWCLQGNYNLAGNPLNIVGNTQPLSIYGGFAGWETTLCDRRAKISTPPTAAIPNYFQFPSILDGGGVAGGNTIINMQGANVCRVDGFLFRNGNAGIATWNNGGGVRVGSSINIWLENLVFMDNVAQNGGGTFVEGTFSIMIKDTLFFRNHATDGSGLYITDGGNTQLVNLLLNENQPRQGIIGNGNGIYIENNIGLKIINNTISGNNGSVTGSSDVYINTANVEIYNSILYPDILVVPGTPPSTNVTVKHCCLANTPPPQPPIPPPANIFVNPLFMNQSPLSGGGNYRLQAGSQCIDRGDTNLIFPYSVTDLEGKPRFINGGNPPIFPPMEVDMGAFEVP